MQKSKEMAYRGAVQELDYLGQGGRWDSGYWAVERQLGDVLQGQTFFRDPEQPLGSVQGVSKDPLHYTE